ncbi:MAG: hypothetical protein ACI8XM_001451 [Haloarculaceae archaeon]|jgi:hypothetical protein
MDPTPDELAGVVDLFGALTRTELQEGLAELAYKRGDEYDTDAFEGTIEEARQSYHLVAVEAEVVGDTADRAPEEDLLVVGPLAFPELPEGATDLPHILDVPDRDVGRETAARAAETQFREETARAVAAEDVDRLQTLLDVSYELEAWGQVDLSATRKTLDEELS